jgi:hypothetical protein
MRVTEVYCPEPTWLGRLLPFALGMLLPIAVVAWTASTARAGTDCDGLVCSLSTYKCAEPPVPPVEPLDCEGGSEKNDPCTETVYCE